MSKFSKLIIIKMRTLATTTSLLLCCLCLLGVHIQLATSQVEEMDDNPITIITTTTTTTATPNTSNSSTANSDSNTVNVEPEPKNPLITNKDWEKLTRLLKINRKKLPLLKKLGYKFDSLVERVNKNKGRINPELFIQEFIPDPLPVKDIKVEEEGFVNSYEGKFQNIQLHGIKHVEIQSISANVGKFTATVKINVPSVYLIGQYQLEGSVAFVSFGGEGNFRMNISDIEIDAFGNLNRTEDGSLQIGSIQLDVRPGEMDLDFEKFEVAGSETLAQGIIGTMSGLVFSQVKSTVLEKTSNKIREKINQRLAKIPFDMVKTESEELFDDLVKFVVSKIDKHVEPLRLPNITKDFEAKTMLMTLNTSIAITNGKLKGLSTFKRTGDIVITYEEEVAMIEAEMGFHSLSGGYDYDLKVLGHGPHGSASLAIHKISSYLRIKQELKRGAVPRLERFHVEEIDHVWMDMNGLGVWDYILEMGVNTVSNAFRVSIANLIASTVTKIIQEELDKEQISFIP